MHRPAWVQARQNHSTKPCSKSRSYMQLITIGKRKKKFSIEWHWVYQPHPRTGCMIWSAWQHGTEPIFIDWLIEWLTDWLIHSFIVKLKLLTVSEILARVWGKGLLSLSHIPFIFFFCLLSGQFPLWNFIPSILLAQPGFMSTFNVPCGHKDVFLYLVKPGS